MTRTICIANQKGGVGKTTTAVNLAAVLARAGQRTLLIDLDPQCNASGALGCPPTARHALVQAHDLAEHVQATGLENLFLLPGSRSFRDVDQLARNGGDNAEVLRKHLAQGLHDFDRVLIDCPPSVGPLTQAALTAAQEVLMPIQCEYFAMEGLSQMICVIRDVMQRRPGVLEFGGILLTMYNPELELTHEVDVEVREFFGDIVFETVIPRDVALSEAPSFGRPIIDYAPRSRGARAYIELGMEVLDRDK